MMQIDEINQLFRRKHAASAPKAAPPQKHVDPPKHEAKAAVPPKSNPPKHESKHEAKAAAATAKRASKPKPPPPVGPNGQPIKKPSLGQRMRDHFHRLGEKMKVGWQHFKEGAKKFIHKVGEGLKTVGLKIAKFAVKAVAVVHTVVGKVVSLIPPFKAVGKYIETKGKMYGAVADKLNSLDHHQSARERKAWKVMDIVQKPAEYAAKAIVHKAEQSKNKGVVGVAKAAGTALKIFG